MDFLKSAVASAISKGPAFGYTFGDRVDLDPSSIWTLYNATKREDGLRSSVFSFDVSHHPSRLPLARNATQKLKMLRHPGVLKVLDSAESDRYIYIATERVMPLSWYVRRQSLSNDTIAWGLRSIANTVKFLNDNGYVHGNIRLYSVYVSESGEWRLGGFDILSLAREHDATIYSHAKVLPGLDRFAPPEILNHGWEVLKQSPLTAIDAFGYGVLVAEVYNNGLSSVDQLATIHTVPSTIAPSYKRLIAQNPNSRLSLDGFLQIGNRAGGFFRNSLIELTDTLEHLDLQDSNTKQDFLTNLSGQLETLPDEFVRLKILPVLLKQAEYGENQCSAISTLVQIRSKFQEADWETVINPVVIRLFGVPDRQLRLMLLKQFPELTEQLSQRTVSNQIFPQWMTGFNDSEALMREETLKSVIAIIPKLTDRIINGDLLRCLAKTANDPHEGIRTNTTICLGKIARNMSAGTRNKVLVVAFTRSLRDPFVHARKAALLTIAATADLFDEADCASRLLPAICPVLVDKDRMVRDQATKTFDSLVVRVKKYADTLPDTKPPVSGSLGGSASSLLSQAGPPQLQSQDSSWAGWAMSSFASKLVSGAIAAAVTPPGGSTPSQFSSGPPPRGGAASAPISSTSVVTAPSLWAQRAHSGLDSAGPIAGVVGGPEAGTTGRHTTIEPDEDGAGYQDALDVWGPGDEVAGTDEDSEVGSVSRAFIPEKQTLKATTSTSGSKKTKAGATAGVKKPIPYDDKGEPDFAGWLSAQKAKKPLPSGLRRPGPGTVSGTKSGTGSSVGVTKKGNVVGAGTGRNVVKAVSAPTAPAPTTGPEQRAEKEKASKVEAESAGDEIDAWADWD